MKRKSYKITAEEAKYFRLWRLYCLKFGHKGSDRDRRRQCHIDALGYDRSHKDFSHTELR